MPVSHRIDLVGARRAPREHRRFSGLHGHQPDPVVLATQRLPGSAQRRRGTHALDEAVDPTAGLLPDLLGDRVVGSELVGVVQLIRPEAPRLRRDGAGGRDHVPSGRLGHPAALARHHVQLGTQHLHVVELLAGEHVGRDNAQGCPFTAHTSASETPVLPPVYSTTDRAAARRPSASPVAAPVPGGRQPVPGGHRRPRRHLARGAHRRGDPVVARRAVLGTTHAPAGRDRARRPRPAAPDAPLVPALPFTPEALSQR
jgi:hypothetical protein